MSAVRRKPWPPPPPYGMAERNAAYSVVASGQLSGFVAAPENFYGGPEVRALEKEWTERFDVGYAVSFNSATSALVAACHAVGMQNGWEVVVTPWSMSASVSCVLMNQGMPIFADLEPETFTLDPESILSRVARRTKAIVAVDLFGCPARMEEINEIADDRGLWVIEDAAQAPGAAYQRRPAGTLGDIGVFSLNQHKPIHAGEGGVAVTSDGDLAEVMALYRNHGENLGSEVVGGNLRLSEVQAAIARVQLSRLDELIEPRISHAERVTAALAELDGLILPVVPEGVRHVFYRYVVQVEDGDAFASALRTEGVPATAGYIPPLNRLRAFSKFDFGHELPVVDRLHRETVLLDLHAGLGEEDVEDVIQAFRKVHAQLS